MLVYESPERTSLDNHALTTEKRITPLEKCSETFRPSTRKSKRTPGITPGNFGVSAMIYGFGTAHLPLALRRLSLWTRDDESGAEYGQKASHVVASNNCDRVNRTFALKKSRNALGASRGYNGMVELRQTNHELSHLGRYPLHKSHVKLKNQE